MIKKKIKSSFIFIANKELGKGRSKKYLKEKVLTHYLKTVPYPLLEHDDEKKFIKKTLEIASRPFFYVIDLKLYLNKK